MEADRVGAMAQLLVDAEAAHAVYEATELNGAYDEEWPAWYARHVVENGLGDILGHEVPADGLADLLATGYAEFDALDPKPAEPWSTYLARRIASRR